mmetsp:Transcript_4303/g.14282  ORF Transcript_4303/g.14282 Transcript_4303/m.14282 type:complete len:305 (+) Transcript_4303:709-1623(+)
MLDEVRVAPRVVVAVEPPLLVGVQEGQVVRLRDEELLTDGVGLLLAVLRPEEDRRHRQRRHHRQRLRRAPRRRSRRLFQRRRRRSGGGLFFVVVVVVVLPGGEEEHLGERRIEGELGHALPQRREAAAVVEGAEDPELVHRRQDVVLGRRIEELEVEEVVDAEGLQKQDDVPEVRTLDLRDLARQKFFPELPLRVEAIAEPRARAPRSPRALGGVRSRDGGHLQGVHADAGVVHLELAEARIDDVLDAVDRQRRLGDVRRHDALPDVVVGGLEYFALQVSGQLRVHRQQQQGRHAVGRPFAVRS